MDWLIFSMLAAICTSLTTIVAKIGLKNLNSNIATGVKTLVVIFFSLFLCVFTKTLDGIKELEFTSILFLILSGVMTALSWSFYFKALKLGSVNKVAPIDKSSFIFTSIFFLIFFFNETTKNGNIITIIMLFMSNLLMLLGTIFMIDNKGTKSISSNKWIVYAILSALFAGSVSLFVKIGLKNVDPKLATLIRTIVVFIFSMIIILFNKDYKKYEKIKIYSLVALIVSGILTGLAWIFEYTALSNIDANPVIVNSIGKFSILFTMLMNSLILKEKFSKKSIVGLFLLVLGILLIIIFGL